MDTLMKKLASWLDRTIYLVVVLPWMNRRLKKAIDQELDTYYRHFTNPKNGWPLSFTSSSSSIKNDIVGFDVGVQLWLEMGKRFPNLKLGIERGGIIYGTIGTQHIHYLPELDEIRVTQNDAPLFCGKGSIYKSQYLGTL